jgi:hypothetical protein
MLVIRREQMKALSAPKLKAFEDRMLLHLRKFFPGECDALGEEKTRAVIRYGIDRAQGHGFKSGRDISRYLNLIFTFGHDFDKDPDLAWASETLRRVGTMPPGELMNRLYAKGKENAVHGRGVSQGS